MKKSGFTLIELLAVIVILAVIALIATPIILGVINDAKQQADLRSIEGYAKAVEYAGVKYMFDNNGTEPADFAAISALVDYQGAPIVCATTTITGGKVALTGCSINGATGTYYNYDGSSGARISS